MGLPPDLLGGSARNRIHGVVRGVVVDNVDPQGAGRVRVMFPTLGDAPSGWALTTRPLGAASGGAPVPINAEVICAFEYGDPSRPVVLGVSQP